jgi:hypothetical protein
MGKGLSCNEERCSKARGTLKARNDGWVRARPDVSSTVLLWTRDMTRPKGIATEKRFLCSRGEPWAGLWSG